MKKKIALVLCASAGVILLLVFINFLPVWNLKTGDMEKLEGSWVNVYYETEREAALDVLALADERAEEIAVQLGFDRKQDVNIYIYDSQSTMQQKKYGLIGPLLGLDWYIGDNIGTDVILTSPANPGRDHNYEDTRYAVLHEMVHAYVSVRNPRVKLWLTEGLALYLANGEPFHRSVLDYIEIPSYQDIQTRNPVKFSEMGGYTFAHTYIEYLNQTYGWDSVLKLTDGGTCEEVLGKSSKDIYEEWVSFLKNYRK